MQQEGEAGVAVHRTTINFSDSLWKGIQRARGRQSATAYICEAVLARIWFEMGRDYAESLERAKSDTLPGAERDNG